MKFLEVVKELQEDQLNDGYIVLMQNGIFFVGIELVCDFSQKMQE